LAEQVAGLARSAPAPAVAICVFDRRRILARAVHGVADLSTGRPVTDGDWWDLASLTKTLITVPEVLGLVDSGRLRLEQPLADCWARARGHAVGDATIGDLLSHRAGLPATVPFFRTLSGRDAVVNAALRAELTNRGTPVYSDLGFLLLGALVEDLSGDSLAALARRRSGLVMGRAPGPAVATEDCPWRGRLIVGEVHDENAWAMGGVAGHAGAFGTLDLVSSAARSWLAEQVVSPALHAAASSCWSSAGSERFGLGWWLAPTRQLGGPVAGPDGYGCSGFVGNRIWFEPGRGYGVVVLSNRVHPRRTDRAPFAAWCDRLLITVAGEVSG
jgi:CubicO group peptidase (beta-lactamase class C family)